MKNTFLKIGLATFVLLVVVQFNSFAKAQDAITTTNPNNTQTQNEEYNVPLNEQQMNNMMNNVHGTYDNNFNQNYLGSENKNMLEHFMGSFAGGFMGLSILALILAIALLAFWLWMLIHAIRHDIDYKPVWILVLWFLTIPGAIIYYFAVKKQCPCCEEWDEEYCDCGQHAKCMCGEDCEAEDPKEEVVIIEEVTEEVK